jgi:hypothetical protein
MGKNHERKGPTGREEEEGGYNREFGTPLSGILSSAAPALNVTALASGGECVHEPYV